LKEGTICELLFYNGKVISIDLPMTVDLEVGWRGRGSGLL
jgi:hypothetical protein